MQAAKSACAIWSLFIEDAIDVTWHWILSLLPLQGAVGDLGWMFVQVGVAQCIHMGKCVIWRFDEPRLGHGLP